jgi:DNA-binding Lrp family transcriptional regulator
MPLDETDISIFKLLRQNPRTPFTEIADTVGISRITAKKRVERMLGENLVKLSVEVNHQNQDGKMAMLGLEVEDKTRWDECISKVNSLPWVLMGFRSMGKANLQVLIYGETDELLEDYIDAFRSHPCVNFINADILGKVLVGEIDSTLLHNSD